MTDLVPVSQDPVDETAMPWESKTLWVSAIVALSPLFPPVQAILVANPEIAAAAVGAVFGFLRLLSGRGKSGKPIAIKK